LPSDSDICGDDTSCVRLTTAGGLLGFVVSFKKLGDGDSDRVFPLMAGPARQAMASVAYRARISSF